MDFGENYYCSSHHLSSHESGSWSFEDELERSENKKYQKKIGSAVV